MKILVANDDGIRAEGIYQLVKALSSVGEIYVCAPDVQRSASGHSISIGVPLKIEEVEFEHAKLALEISGTPADCVKLGLKVLKNKGIDILINTPTKANDSLRDGFRIRRTAIEYGVEVLTSLDTLNVIIRILEQKTHEKNVDVIDISKI